MKMIKTSVTKILQAGLVCLVIANMACSEEKDSNAEKKHEFTDSLVSLRNKGKDLRNEGRYDEALLLHNDGLTLAKSIGDTCEWV